MNLQPMPPDELNDLARRIVTNEVYITNTPEGLNNSFGILLGLMTKDAMPDSEAEKVGAMWEEWSAQGPRSINGFPTFFSGHFLHKDDLAPLQELIEKKEAALNG